MHTKYGRRITITPFSVMLTLSSLTRLSDEYEALILCENFNELILVFPDGQGHTLLQHFVVSMSVWNTGVWIDGNLRLGQIGNNLEIESGQKYR